ncbi:cardiolipin synthase ClsB [Piscinibacter sakaiensis]|uniref:cardiolipin synthase ClsB n=1 Tax=Piscinibacter sakaiensis TaxID=1547922 RepID=UPI003AACD87D
MSGRWFDGNKVTLLENGEAFFPRVFEAINAARKEVLLETFILFEDKVGLALHEALLGAAKRGVRVSVLVDGYGSPDLSEEFIGSLIRAGVRFQVFDPMPKLFGLRLNVLRRMHRKLIVIDGERAFIGGINFSADHLADFGPQAKQDYSAEVEGPVVGIMLNFARRAARVGQPSRRWLRRTPLELPPPAGEAEALFVTRDNRHHRDDIERNYRAAIRAARKRVWIANAYFFPGYRFIRELRKAARRGVEVILILQGEPDMPVAKAAASTLYENLTRAGVQIHEYCRRPLHGKVALVDDEWATIGSSNLDPLSLSLNLEANLIVRDRELNHQLGERLQRLLETECKKVMPEQLERSNPWTVFRNTLIFHFLRHFPRWAPRLPSIARQAAPMRL